MNKLDLSFNVYGYNEPIDDMKNRAKDYEINVLLLLLSSFDEKIINSTYT